VSKSGVKIINLQLELMKPFGKQNEVHRRGPDQRRSLGGSDPATDLDDLVGPGGEQAPGGGLVVHVHHAVLAVVEGDRRGSAARHGKRAPVTVAAARRDHRGRRAPVTVAAARHDHRGRRAPVTVAAARRDHRGRRAPVTVAAAQRDHRGRRAPVTVAAAQCDHRGRRAPVTVAAAQCDHRGRRAPVTVAAARRDHRGCRYSLLVADGLVAAVADAHLELEAHERNGGAAGRTLPAHGLAALPAVMLGNTGGWCRLATRGVA